MGRPFFPERITVRPTVMRKRGRDETKIAWKLSSPYFAGTFPRPFMEFAIIFQDAIP
jgi:hypothetical protein